VFERRLLATEWGLVRRQGSCFWAWKKPSLWIEGWRL